MATYAPVIRKGMLRAPMARYRGYPGGQTYREGLARSLTAYTGYGVTTSELEALAKLKSPAGISSGAAVAGVGLILTFAALSTFVFVPWVAKWIKPDWNYGQRVVAGMVFTAGLGAIGRVGKD